jgi:hypothetical protein
MAGRARRAERTAAPAWERLGLRCTRICTVRRIARPERGSSEWKTRGEQRKRRMRLLVSRRWRRRGSMRSGGCTPIRRSGGGGGWWVPVRCNCGGGLRLAAYVLHREAVKARRVRGGCARRRVAGRKRQRQARLRLCEVRQHGHTPTSPHTPPTPTPYRHRPKPTPMGAKGPRRCGAAHLLFFFLLFVFKAPVPVGAARHQTQRSRGQVGPSGAPGHTQPIPAGPPRGRRLRALGALFS